MRSRAATKSAIEKGTIYLITLRTEKITFPIAASKNVKDALAFAKMVGQINEPNLSYKGLLRALKKDLAAKLWDKSKHEEGAKPDNDYVDIRPIKLL